MLQDPTFAQIRDAMFELEMKADRYGRVLDQKTNFFVGYSGHGTSILGNLNLTLPTILTEEKYS